MKIKIINNKTIVNLTNQKTQGNSRFQLFDDTTSILDSINKKKIKVKKFKTLPKINKFPKKINVDIHKKKDREVFVEQNWDNWFGKDKETKTKVNKKENSMFARIAELEKKVNEIIKLMK